MLDISGGSVANGGNAQVYSWNATNAQVWNLVKIAQTIDDGLYEIYSRVDGNRLIDVSGGLKADDAKLQIWNRNGTLAQNWSISVCDDGSVLIKGADSGKYLSQSNGQLMSVKVAVEGSHWIPRVSSMGGLVLVNAVSGAVIDLTGANTAAGSAIQMYTNNFTAAQAWRFVAASLIDDGVYVVVNQSSSNRVLDVAGGSCSAGAHVQLYTANGTNAQKWYVRSLGNGAYSLTAFVSGKALDVPSANASNGASVQQWDWNGSGAQKWLFRLADVGGIAIYSMLADGSFALMDSVTVLFLATVAATHGASILRLLLSSLTLTLTVRKGDLSTLLAPLLPLVPIFAPRGFRECLMQPVMAMHTEMPATCFGLIATTATALI